MVRASDRLLPLSQHCQVLSLARHVSLRGVNHKHSWLDRGGALTTVQVDPQWAVSVRGIQSLL